MQKLKKNIFISFIILIFFGNITFAKENKILIKVNNEIITTIDILNEINFLSIMNKEFRSIEKKEKINIAKNSLIKQKIKFIEISKYKKNLNLDNSIFENIVKSYFINFQINNLNEFEVFFNKQNLDPTFIKKKILVDTFWNRLIYEKFSQNVKINRDEIKKSILKKGTQKEYLLSEIVFNIEDKEKLNTKVQKITKTIKDKNFAEAALNFSISDSSKNGGELGWIQESVLSDKIINEVRKTKIGDFTNSIIIPGGFIILNLENVREIKKDIDPDKEFKIIIEKKTNEQLKIFSNIYLNKLKKNIKLNET